MAANLEQATDLLVLPTVKLHEREICLASIVQHKIKVQAAEARVSQVVSKTRLKKAKKGLKQRNKKWNKASKRFADANLKLFDSLLI
ncbi:hypothetical protein OROHE_005951 [Orobanche hederae]